jgi:SAM-dependent methyltransferase
MIPDEMMQTLRGFQESRVALTAIELDLFTAVGGGTTAAGAAQRIKADARATEMLLNALVSMGWLEKREGRFFNTRGTARCFVAGSPEDARMAMMHQVHLWTRWSTLTEVVKAGTAVVSGRPEERDESWTRAFIAAMHHNASERAVAVTPHVPLRGVRRMLDLGGGSGAYSIAFARANPELHSDVFDLPSVLPLTQEYVRAAALSDRISTRPGDMRADPLGGGYDLVWISAICHMFSEQENRDLFQRVHDALAAAGRIVVQDFILDADKTSPRNAALFSLNMLVGTRSGASYSEPEYAEWLKAARFSDVQRVHIPGQTGLMIGSRS